MRTRLLFTAVLVSGLLAAGCGGSDSPTSDDAVGQPGDGTAMCAPGVTDCVDVVVEDDGASGACLAGSTECADDPTAPDQEQAAVDHAKALLGVAEADLGADVRISRRGDEQFMLTEDYVIGRMTAELDADAGGVYRVTAITIELEDGPQTVRG